MCQKETNKPYIYIVCILQQSFYFETFFQFTLNKFNIDRDV